MTNGPYAIFTSANDPELIEEKEQNIMKGEKQKMTVIINYKKYNKDDSYEIKSYIEKYIDGVISHGEKELIVINGTNTIRFDHIVQFSIINDN